MEQMTEVDLAGLIGTEPAIDDAAMPYGNVDVQRIAKAVSKGWVFALFYGMSPKGVAHILRDLWLNGYEKMCQLATVEEAYRHLLKVEMPAKLKKTVQQVETFERRTDTRIETAKGDFKRFVRKGAKPAAVIIGDWQFDATFGMHGIDLCSKTRISDGSRLAFTYEGLPIATAPGMVGPLIVDDATYKALLAVPGLGLRER